MSVENIQKILNPYECHPVLMTVITATFDGANVTIRGVDCLDTCARIVAEIQAGVYGVVLAASGDDCWDMWQS